VGVQDSRQHDPSPLIGQFASQPPYTVCTQPGGNFRRAAFIGVPGFGSLMGERYLPSPSVSSSASLGPSNLGLDGSF
jgi:hypothetical protein